MVKFLIAAVLFIGLSAGVNAQSKDCCAKDKADVTTVKKHCDVPETVTKDAEETKQIAGALSSDKTTKETKTTAKVKTVTDDEKENKSCCTEDKKKTDEPNK